MRKLIVFGLLFLMLLMPVMGVSEIEKTYILTPEKNTIKIKFPDLTKEYNLKDEALKKGITSKDLCKVEKTIYKGNGIITLKAYQNITKQKIKNSYECNCKDIKKEIIDNKTGKKKTEIIKVCDTCYIYENYIVSELIEINPDKFKIDKNTEIYEVFEGCSKIEELNNGKWGCSLWSDVNILGTEIKGATWWNVSFDYRQEINLSNTAGILTDYQVKITLNTTNFNYSHANTTGKDIRFTNSSDDSLDYWIEDWNITGDSIIWVEVNSLANATNTSIYMYYGNNAVSSESNGISTFLSFSDGSLESDWDDSGNIDVSNSNGELRVQQAYGDSNSATRSLNIAETKYILEFRAKTINTATNDQMSIIDYDGSASHRMVQLIIPRNNIQYQVAYYDGGVRGLYNSFVFNIYYRYKLIINEGTKIEYLMYSDSLSLLNSANTTSFYGSPTDSDISVLGSGTGAGATNAYISWIYYRKYASSEPAYTIGSEENYIIPPLTYYSTIPKRLYFYPERRFYYQ